MIIIEFLMANLEKNDCVNKSNLKLAFDFFDEDHSGTISEDELKRIFIGLKGTDDIKKIIKEVDINNDGEISFDEFAKMMEIYVDKFRKGI